MASGIIAAQILLFFLYLWDGNLSQARNLDQTPNTRPIIGIIALDTRSQHGKSFIPVSYVTYLQEAGARVVPIRGGYPKRYYDSMVNFTNGILLPGGSLSIKSSLFGRSAKYIFERALQINGEGDYFPIWGTCLGFQTLCYLAAKRNYLKKTDSRNVSWPLFFTKEAASSRMFRNAPSDIKDYLTSEFLTQNQHQYSILLDTFQSTNLSSFFKVLSTNKDRNGLEFVSTVEAKNYPIYGSQWHPEKNNLNWNPNYNINHGDHAVMVSQYMANFFVREARKSNHRFPDVKSEAENLIQNYKRVYFNDGTFFENYYI